MRLHRGPGKGFGPYDLVVIPVGVALAWSIAATNHFSEAWLFFASVATAAFAVGFLRKLFRV